MATGRAGQSEAVARCRVSAQPTLAEFLNVYAGRARLLADSIHESLIVSIHRQAGRLKELHAALCEYLHPDLSQRSFADEIAHGIAIGFLSHYYYVDGEFDRDRACGFLQVVSTAMREVFTLAAPSSACREVDSAAEELAAILRTPLAEVVPRDDGTGVEPLMGLYEKFLDCYAPGLRVRRGIYLTPKPLASYIVRSVDFLLHTRFGKTNGLADPDVRLLDPAAGPGIFLEEALLGAALSGAASTAPPKFRGYEITLPTYVIGRMATQALLDSCGWHNRRFPFYLTDALADPKEIPLDPLSWELAAGFDLRDEPISVVLGNPPFSGHSENRGRWISALLREGDQAYYPRGERNSKWLQDDYVKFLRLAQWTIEQNGEGIVAFVVNHNCLDAITFSSLRASLLGSFEEIFIYDLHGNGRKRERTPTGRCDENVFHGVAQGIAILILVKRSCLARRTYRADLYGSRKEKLRHLAQRDLATTRWLEIPSSYRGVRTGRPRIHAQLSGQL